MISPVSTFGLRAFAACLLFLRQPRFYSFLPGIMYGVYFITFGGDSLRPKPFYANIYIITINLNLPQTL